MSADLEFKLDNIIDLSVNIISAYVSNNSVTISDLPGVIQGIHKALRAIATKSATAFPEVEVVKPSAAKIRKSVTPEGIISFLDGKTYKTLKRHISIHGLDPHGYRARFGLPTEYPMVAPAYAARRSELGKSIGLGRVSGREKFNEAKA